MLRYTRAESLDEATAALERAGVVPVGGGTDLITWIDEGLARPEELVDLRFVNARPPIAEVDGGLRIEAHTRIADIARSAVIASSFAALAESCASVGTAALRNMGTLGGNLCQRPRCWYLRRNVRCHKNGGSDCPAVKGENQYHAILGGGPCYIVHPSDPAVALTALNASVVIASPGGRSRTVPIEDFYVLPSTRLDHETVLGNGEVVASVHVPSDSAGQRQGYRKLMQRGAWDFALVSIGYARRADGEVRLVLGGVAPVPWRVASSVEEDVASGGIDEDAAEVLADRALYDAEPLERNEYKVKLARALLVRAIMDLGAGE
jgi:xanthine dehydrogenase YagS FAD-binding subunit